MKYVHTLVELIDLITSFEPVHDKNNSFTCAQVMTRISLSRVFTARSVSS